MLEAISLMKNAILIIVFQGCVQAYNFDNELLTCPYVDVYDLGLHRKLWSWVSVRGNRLLLLLCAPWSTWDPLVV